MLEVFEYILREEAALFIEDFAAKQSTNVALDPRGIFFTIHFFFPAGRYFKGSVCKI